MRRSLAMEKRGLKREEIEGWLLANGGEKSDKYRIEGPGWRVVFLEERTKLLGPMHFPVVKLRIEAEEDLFENFLRRFRMHFLRGGA